jgi:hypothetical protein
MIGGMLLCAAGCGGSSGAAALTELPAGCPRDTEEPTAKIDPALWDAWQRAEAGLLVRVLLELEAQPTAQEYLGIDGAPTAAQQATFDAYVRTELQACTVALVRAVGGEVLGQFAGSGNAVAARVNRDGGLALASYVDVANVLPIGALPPEAGSALCGDLDEAGCAAREDCRIVSGSIWNAVDLCASPPVPVGCVDAAQAGGATGAWAATPGGQCVLVAGGVAPSSWLAPVDCPTALEPAPCASAP